MLSNCVIVITQCVKRGVQEGVPRNDMVCRNSWHSVCYISVQCGMLGVEKEVPHMPLPRGCVTVKVAVLGSCPRSCVTVKVAVLGSCPK